MFKHILVPVDGSHASSLGLDKAIRLAQEQRATLHVLHVIDNRAVTQSLGLGMGSGAGIDGLFESLRDSGRKVLASAEARARKHKIRVKAALVDNSVRSVADVIVSQAKKLRADLIVLGTHGRRGISRLVMGSDAEGVVRNTPAPVLLVRSKARGKG